MNLSLILSFMKGGYNLLMKNKSIVIMAFIFVAIDSVIPKDYSFEAKSTDPIVIVNNIIDLLSTYDVFFAAIAAFLVKVIFILYSGFDLILAKGNIKNRYRKISKLILIKPAATYLAFSIIWYFLFFLIGFSIMAIVNLATIHIYAKIAVIGLLGFSLFPVFYAGLSLGSFFIAIEKISVLTYYEFMKVTLLNYKSIYLFYLFRSIADIVTVSSALYVLSLLSPFGFLLKLFATVVLMSMIIMFFRSTTLEYKVSIYKDIYNKAIASI